MCYLRMVERAWPRWLKVRKLSLLLVTSYVLQDGERERVHMNDHPPLLPFSLSPSPSSTDLVLSSVVSLMSLNRPIMETTPTHTSKLAHRHSRPICTMKGATDPVTTSPSHTHTHHTVLKAKLWHLCMSTHDLAKWFPIFISVSILLPLSLFPTPPSSLIPD